MQQIKRRRPQKVCKCGHARKNHSTIRHNTDPLVWGMCHFCYMDCPLFQQNNLATLERLYQYNEEKKTTIKLSL